jgi:hypothetical protein
MLTERTTILDPAIAATFTAIRKWADEAKRMILESVEDESANPYQPPSIEPLLTLLPNDRPNRSIIQAELAEFKDSHGPAQSSPSAPKRALKRHGTCAGPFYIDARVRDGAKHGRDAGG